MAALGLCAALIAACEPEVVAGQPLCPGVPVPQLVSASPDTQLNARFTAAGNASTSLEWSAADGNHTVRLPDGRVMFLFGDTILGPVNADGSRPDGVHGVHNSFVLQDPNGDLSTVITASDPPDAAIRPAGEDKDVRWWWPGATTMTGGVVQIIAHQVRKGGDGEFGFIGEKEVLVRLSPTGFTVLSVDDLPSGPPEVDYGGWVLYDDGYTYVYGSGAGGQAGRYAHIARVRGTDLRGTWEFYTNPGWSRDATKAAQVFDGVNSVYSVTKLGKAYLLLTHTYDQTTPTKLGDGIVAYFSCSPLGPFTHRTSVYEAPEGGPDGTYKDADIYTYNTLAHPALSSPDGRRVVLSYNVGSTDFFGDLTDASIYRPRYVDVEFR